MNLTFILSINAQHKKLQPNDLYQIIESISAERIQKDITQLSRFGTRHTLSDTLSDTRGIGAARRWILKEFQEISKDCNHCLEVFEQKNFFPKDEKRLVHDVWINNIVAIQRSTENPNDFIIMSGDIDSRVSDVNNFSDDAPGANDNASGMAGTLEAARVLSQYEFKNSIIYVGLSGEEQGLYGGQGLVKYAQENNWNIIGVLNNDMIGNIQGIDGVIDNQTFRIFSEPYSPTLNKNQLRSIRYYGGEVDGISRQLARYVFKTTREYMPEMNPMMVYRLDRFGRGGHHKPFCDAGYAGIRIMEAHENYNWQHQDIRMEDNIAYGDVLEHVNFQYAKKLTAVNAINLASIAAAPLSPKKVSIGGMVEPSVQLQWEAVPHAKGYTIYWRDTTSPTWQYSRYVGETTQITLENIVIDNYYFGVAAMGENGFESVVTFPNSISR